MDPRQLIALLNTPPWSVHADDIKLKAVDIRQPFWQWSLIARAMAPSILARDRRIISITGSQGSGKSTLARTLVQQFEALGVAAACVSLDDFYLSKQSRADLSRDVHPLLATRGVPGTHDSSRLGEVLEQFANSKGLLTERLPQFDKGLDDRLEDIQVQAEVLVLEGWCLGVQPQPPELLRQPVNDLERLEDSQSIWRQWCNEQIRRHYQPLWALVDAWMLLQPPGFAQVLEWRRQQELDLPPAQRMSEAALQRFIQHYERLTRWQWLRPMVGRGMAIDLTEDHDIAAIRPLSRSD